MKSRLIIIILLVFSLSTEAQVRRTTIRAFWQTVRNTISGETPTPPTVEKAFYVSSTGSDSNPGTLAEPFQTLDKINSLALTDTSKVYLKRGDSFIGTLTVQSDSITYDAYGSGAKPIITGFTTISGWTSEGGGIYSKTLAVESSPEIVTINGVQYAMGRTPNSDRYNLASTDYFHIDNNIAGTVTSAANYSGTVTGTILITTSSAHNITTGDYITLSLSPTTYNGSYTATVVNSTQFYVSKTYSATATGTAYNNMQIIDTEIPFATQSWIGAEAVIRGEYKTDWMRCSIIEHDVDTIKFTNSGNDLIDAGYGYFIQNHLATLDRFGEWYYGEGKFYMYFGAANPVDYTVKVSVKDNLMDITHDYITVKNIKFEGANDLAVSTLDNYTTIDNCNFDFNLTSIYGYTAHGITLTNNNILRSSDRGIYSHFNNQYYIANNTIDSTGLILGANTGIINNKTMSGLYAGFAKNVSGYTKGIIEFNSVSNSGFYGITFGGDSAIARNNYIDGFCLRLSDGGGLHKTGTSSGTDTLNFRNMVFADNIITNSYIQTDALGLPASTINTQINGIYVDVYSFDITVDGNTVSNVPNGAYLLGVQDFSFTNNTIYNCDYGAKFHKRGNGADLTLPIRNLTANGNIIVNENNSKPLVSFKDLSEGELLLFGTMNNNYYSSPITNSTPFEQSIIYSLTDLSLDNWRINTGEDGSSYLTYNKGAGTIFDYNKTSTPKTVSLGSTYMTADSTEITSYTLNPYESIVAFKDTIQTIEIDSIYAAYPLNVNANDTVGVQNGTVTGAVITASGKFKGAYDFQTNTDNIYFPVNTSALTAADSSYSVSFWVKLDQTASTLGYSTYLVSDIKTGTSYKMALQINTSNTLVFQVRNNALTTYTVNSATGALGTAGVWYNIILNVPSAWQIGQIYINGVRSTGGSQNQFAGLSRTTDYRFYLSRYTGTSGFDGKIDDFVIRKCWTTPQEAEYIYNSGAGRYYPFTE